MGHQPCLAWTWKKPAAAEYGPAAAAHLFMTAFIVIRF
jgi:hypothetical protein